MSQELEKLKLIAEINFAWKQFDIASLNYLAYLMSKPNDAEITYNLGLCYVETGQYDYAIDCFTKSHNLNPHDEDAASAAAYWLLHKGAYKDAAYYYSKSTIINPENSEFWYYRALSELSAGDIAIGINSMNHCSTMPDGYGQMASAYMYEMNQNLEYSIMCIGQLEQ